MGMYNKICFFPILKCKAKTPMFTSQKQLFELWFITPHVSETRMLATVRRLETPAWGPATQRLFSASRVLSHASRGAQLHFIFHVAFYFLWTLTWRLGLDFECVLFNTEVLHQRKCCLIPGGAFVYTQAFHSSSLQFSSSLSLKR